MEESKLVRAFFWIMISVLLLGGFNTCYNKGAIDAGCMIAVASLYVGVKFQQWQKPH